MKKRVLKPINILLTVLVIMLFSACGKTENPGDSISVGGFPAESEEVTDEKNDIDSLIDSLEVYGDKEPYEKLYSGKVYISYKSKSDTSCGWSDRANIYQR